MHIEILDLLTPETYSVYSIEEGASEKTLNFKPVFTERISNVLIYPKRNNSNRCPYLQDFQNPEISDLLDDAGNIASLDNTFLLNELLGTIIYKSGNRNNLNDYFLCLRQHISQNLQIDTGCDLTIILVPDFFTPSMQESLLQSTGFPRDRTFLLWRSVAACLGSEAELLRKGFTGTNKIAVVDCSAAYQLVSVLNVVQENKQLVPVREAFPWKHQVMDRDYLRNEQAASSYPHFELDLSYYRKKDGNLKNRFHQLVTRGRTAMIPCFGEWINNKYSELEASFPEVVDFSPRNYACILELKDSPIYNTCCLPTVITNRQSTMLEKGAAVFAYRHLNNLPTYYDQMEGLWIVGQNPHEEKVVTVELIPSSSRCLGGQWIYGTPYDKAYIEPNTNAREKPHADFYLADENLDRKSTQLKKYVHEFDIHLQDRKPIELQPKAMPGQGLAMVAVKNVPGYDNGIILDLLKMEDAVKIVDNKEVPITVAELEKSIKRSYPPDIPHIEASRDLWNNCRKKVDRYMRRGIFPADANGIFARSRWINGTGRNVQQQGLNSLRRENVFGTNPVNKYPCKDFNFDDLFNKLAELWEKSRGSDRQNDYMRIIAWTYQGEHKAFSKIIATTLRKAKRMSDGEDRLEIQEYTLLGNMLRNQSGLRDFFVSFLKQFSRYEEYGSPIYNWTRALSLVSSLNNDMFNGIESTDCRKGMEYLAKLLCKYNNEDPPKGKKTRGAAAYRYVLGSMMFILKKRRTDPNFILKGTRLFQDIYECLAEVASLYPYTIIEKQAECVRLYLSGEGTIDGLTSIIDDGGN